MVSEIATPFPIQDVLCMSRPHRRSGSTNRRGYLLVHAEGGQQRRMSSYPASVHGPPLETICMHSRTGKGKVTCWYMRKTASSVAWSPSRLTKRARAAVASARLCLLQVIHVPQIVGVRMSITCGRRSSQHGAAIELCELPSSTAAGAACPAP